MATFKVGQRVRCVAKLWLSNADLHFIGAEGVIADRPLVAGRFYPVTFDKYGFGGHFAPEELAPLCTPAADTWATDAVRKVTKPQHVEPVAPKRDVVKL